MQCVIDCRIVYETIVRGVLMVVMVDVGNGTTSFMRRYCMYIAKCVANDDICLHVVLVQSGQLRNVLLSGKWCSFVAPRLTWRHYGLREYAGVGKGRIHNVANIAY